MTVTKKLKHQEHPLKILTLASMKLFANTIQTLVTLRLRGAKILLQGISCYLNLSHIPAFQVV